MTQWGSRRPLLLEVLNRARFLTTQQRRAHEVIEMSIGYKEHWFAL
jgi:hypothetical protein